jgi:hypothetical protein
VAFGARSESAGPLAAILFGGLAWSTCAGGTSAIDWFETIAPWSILKLVPLAVTTSARVGNTVSTGSKEDDAVMTATQAAESMPSIEQSETSSA